MAVFGIVIHKFHLSNCIVIQRENASWTKQFQALNGEELKTGNCLKGP